jgi:hypothetical protein
MTYEWQGELIFANAGDYNRFQNVVQPILDGAGFVYIGDPVFREQRRRGDRTILIEATTQPADNAVAVFQQIRDAAIARNPTIGGTGGERGSYLMLLSQDRPAGQAAEIFTLAEWPVGVSSWPPVPTG